MKKNKVFLLKIKFEAGSEFQYESAIKMAKAMGDCMKSFYESKNKKTNVIVDLNES